MFFASSGSPRCLFRPSSMWMSEPRQSYPITRRLRARPSVFLIKEAAAETRGAGERRGTQLGGRRRLSPAAAGSLRQLPCHPSPPAPPATLAPPPGFPPGRPCVMPCRRSAPGHLPGALPLATWPPFEGDSRKRRKFHPPPPIPRPGGRQSSPARRHAA